ncbi:hypothetical protein OPV22_009725 [Ensete ventricosum]|uniref:KIB1-4 beta-propeller domain-containing protein n=1 Tax=Ensete ventricosum TaxID=4639 RepID=A0AAV8RGK0_ENSVE|nr:hypothetical protein OPV22_009725 [Ensete ventricosum]RWV89370.1 hypothetical protein GW17_00048483 [Ensete ventricosum]
MTPHPSYLVVSAGELLLVTCHYNRTAGGKMTPGVRVFRLETGGISRPAVAVEVEDVHDCVLFLNPSSSVSVTAEGFFGFPGNAIYFIAKDEFEERAHRGGCGSSAS